MDGRRGSRAGGNAGVRLGHQQSLRAGSNSPGSAKEHRAVLPGSRPCGARWAAGELLPVLAKERFRVTRLLQWKNRRRSRERAGLGALPRNRTVRAIDGMPSAPGMPAFWGTAEMGELRRVRRLCGPAVLDGD